jgi:hypothetical protein
MAMTTLMDVLSRARRNAVGSLRVFLGDVGAGALEVSHNTLALVCLVVIAAAVFAFGNPDIRGNLEQQAFGWLKARKDAQHEREGNVLAFVAEPTAVARATAADLKSLPAPQASVALWISRRYKVAPEPIGRLVQEAWSVGQRAGLDPELILAVMAVESSFNPFAQSHVGAQGLMQVMTRVHDEKYVQFGGQHAAFDPLTNLRVGVQVLKDCIVRAGGGLEDGLRYYLGAANFADDGGYAARVLAERANLRMVASGKSVAINAPLPATTAPTPLQASDRPLKIGGETPAASGGDRVALNR